MALQGPIVVVAERPAASLVQALTEAGAFPVVEAGWRKACDAIASIKPAAVVLAEADGADAASARELEETVARCDAYVPVVARIRDGGNCAVADALPVSENAPHAQIVARLNGAARLRALHATVVGRARDLHSERNIVAEFPTNDPVEDATVLLVGRGRTYPRLSVAIGERMGVVGAMSVDIAARCLNARDFDGVVIGDGLSEKLVCALLTVIGQDSRFRDLPVAILGPEEHVEELPNLVDARDPADLIERLLPLVRQHAMEARLRRMLRSIDSKGMLDPRTGLLNADAFGRNLARTVEEAGERGTPLSVARFFFDGQPDLRATFDTARLIGRLIRPADFACRQDDGSIVTVFGNTDLRGAHMVARRLASVIRHTLFGSGPNRGSQAHVTLATLKAGDTPITLMARIAAPAVAAE
jgi:GGDEF domain-containing protein